MDLSRLSLADKLVAAGAIVLLISTFLPWYGWSLGGFGVVAGSVNASLWDASGFIAFLILAAAVIAVGILVLRVMDILDLSDQGVPEGLVVLAAAGLAAVLTLFRLAVIPGGVGVFGVGRSWGLWVGLVAAAIFVLGAFIKFQEERA